MNSLNFWVLGGDKRQSQLAEQLADDGHPVHTYALPPLHRPLPNVFVETTLDPVSTADVVILPLPAMDERLDLNTPLADIRLPFRTLMRHLRPHQFICGGKLSPAACQAAEEYDLEILDYFQREELVIANCIPTAEGCLQIAMEQLPVTVHGLHMLITGFGRVGRVTAQRFAALGAQVTVCARSQEQLAWAACMGFSPLPLPQLSKAPLSFDLAVNTVPAPVFTAQTLCALSPTGLIIDLASAPGGDGVLFRLFFRVPLDFFAVSGIIIEQKFYFRKKDGYGIVGQAEYSGRRRQV